MNHVLITVISTVLLLKSSMQFEKSPYTSKPVQEITISFSKSPFHDDDMKTILEKSLLKHSPKTVHILKLENVRTSEIFRNSTFDAFTELNTLRIVDGKIHHFPESTFEGLMNIKKLELSNNLLQSLSANLFKSTPKLNLLTVDHNSLADLPVDVFKHVPDLWQLNLSYNDLTSLPKGIFNCSNLTSFTHLFLEHNRISALEEGVFQTPTLKVINLSQNMVGRIDKNVFHKLRNLLTVKMTATFIPKVLSLPKELFSNSSQLETIEMNSNYFETLEVGIFHNLQRLTKLDLSNNELRNISGKIFEDNINLQTLDLSENKLQYLNEAIFTKLFRLRELDLSYNNLKDLSTEIFFDLTSLTVIDISYNEVNLDANDGFSILQNSANLTKIVARNNKISKIFPDWRRSSLITLDLTSNPLPQSELNTKSELPKLIYFTSHNATNVKLRDTSASKLSSDAGKIIILDRDKNCDNDTVLGCSCKIYFEFESNRTVLMCNRFDEEKLDKWPYDILNRTSLQYYFIEIILANCSITSLYPVKKYVAEVQHRLFRLVLSGNNLTDLKGLEGNFPVLKELQLDKNQFTNLEPSAVAFLKSSTSLESITLRENPWSCNCSMEDFFDFIQTHRKLVSDSDRITCINIPGNPILSLAFNDICPIDYRAVIFVGLSFAMLAFIGIGSMYFYHTYEKEIKLWIFVHPWLRCLVAEKEVDRHLKYDAFISYAAPDEWFVEELVPELECGERPYKLCIHQRDWLAGDYIPTQIHRSVEQSRRTIIILSPNFLNSFWGKKEFQAAYLKSMKERCSRIIIILLQDVDVSNLDDEMKAYISTNTYLHWKDRMFWNKLRYALPHTYRIRCKRTQEELLFP